jgi:hypothetical protein
MLPVSMGASQPQCNLPSSASRAVLLSYACMPHSVVAPACMAHFYLLVSHTAVTHSLAFLWFFLLPMLQLAALDVSYCISACASLLDFCLAIPAALFVFSLQLTALDISYCEHVKAAVLNPHAHFSHTAKRFLCFPCCPCCS